MKVVDKYEVVVIGGGHAGVEAASVASRYGAKTLLITHDKSKIGEMSCNPAIGGIGKSHLAKEVDALGGLMAKAADKSGIHYRVLNSTKGQAVRATRVQTDRDLYKLAIQELIVSTKNLTIKEGSVIDLDIDDLKIKSVKTDSGEKIFTKSVVLTTGTFLGGVMHTGLEQSPGGRIGDPSSEKLAKKLRKLNLSVGRLKTGTPPRLNKNTINWDLLSPQSGDTPTPLLSYTSNEEERPKQLDCFMTRTNKETHKIIIEHLDESPMYSGVIEGVGPRYCPSIEDKVMRFSERDSHQIFAEPEGLNSDLIYPNGISTSLPLKAQEALVRSIKGFEKAEIIRPGYAIEYDYFDPKGLKHSLETKEIEGLFFAGQINGTTGYEEAAAQGLMAGLNAALQTNNKAPLILRRDEAYTGVLIDDLVSLGTKEPYRMFTSRAEYRLILREDNADMRLTEKGKELGIVPDLLWKTYLQKKELSNNELERLKKEKIKPNSPEAEKIHLLSGETTSNNISLLEILKRPKVFHHHLPQGEKILPNNVIDEIEASVKYEGYIKRQKADIEKLQRNENTPIPSSLDYSNVVGLSNEVKQKLTEARPESLARASRLPGITPAAISLLMVHIKKGRRLVG
ncbi:MAG: tRNA uridine-5-carboxymethylaminomethyl(34) synthesis enzyme MnmG [SAR86 cluster bacterium]|nr:tRNA uridine-5-carboxymethylaminomethyl(34) synthesis enzyme MnmG [SAR86 cluster bacterium]